MIYSQGGIVRGKGQIIRKNGEVIDFELTSEPLTEEQAEQLNNEEGKNDGSNASDNC